MLFALRYTIRNKALFKSLSLQCGRKLEKPTARREFPGPELNQQKRKLNPCVAKRGFSLCRFSQFYYFQFSFYFIHVLFVRTHVRPFLRALTSDHDQAGKSRVINLIFAKTQLLTTVGYFLKKGKVGYLLCRAQVNPIYLFK